MLTCKNWKNKNGTGKRKCVCGTWKQHWINFSNKSWPDICSVSDCTNKPTLGVHVINYDVSGEKIVPMCDSCNKFDGFFNLRSGVMLVDANKSKTCEKHK